jgi:hypothetical protein
MVRGSESDHSVCYARSELSEETTSAQWWEDWVVDSLPPMKSHSVDCSSSGATVAVAMCASGLGLLAKSR